MVFPRRHPRTLGAGNDAGFTIVEVAIAAVILVVSGLAVLGLVDAASRNDFRATQSQVVNDRLQQEMEAIKELPYNQVALTSAPPHSPDSTNPNFRVTGTQFNVNESGAASNENLVYNGTTAPQDNSTVSGGTINPGPSSFQSGNVTGQVYRYVTWERDSSCNNCATSWYRHVVVAVALDKTAPGGTRAYQEIQGNLSNPKAGLPPSQGGPGGPGPGEGGGGGGTGGGGGGGTGPSGNDATPWTFWLTDTPCNNSSRQPIAAEHQTHNTLGVCSNGLHTGGTAGAPDLMFTQAAPIDNNYPSDQQPLYDYATDVEPGCSGTNCFTGDKGLQEKIPSNLLSGGGCLTDLNGTTSLLTLGSEPQYYIHKWVSPTVPSGFSNIVLDGTGELDLWTQTIDGAVDPGKICVWLFTRHLNGLGIPVDTFAVNTGQAGNLSYFTYSQASWPNNGWTEIHLPLRFAALTLPAGDRFGLAVGVERQGTLPGSGLQFEYDHPSFDSRLELDTHSLLPIF